MDITAFQGLAPVLAWVYQGGAALGPGSCTARSHLAHFGIALLYDEQQGHQRAGQLLVHGLGAGCPEPLNHFAVDVDAGSPHHFSCLRQTGGSG